MFRNWISWSKIIKKFFFLHFIFSFFFSKKTYYFSRLSTAVRLFQREIAWNWWELKSSTLTIHFWYFNSSFIILKFNPNLIYIAFVTKTQYFVFFFTKWNIIICSSLRCVIYTMNIYKWTEMQWITQLNEL